MNNIRAGFIKSKNDNFGSSLATSANKLYLCRKKDYNMEIMFVKRPIGVQNIECFRH